MFRQTFNSIQFYYSHFYKIFTLSIVRCEYTNNGEQEGKIKKFNGLGRSVRWSEELSFRANHRYIMIGLGKYIINVRLVPFATLRDLFPTDKFNSIRNALKNEFEC